MDQKDVESLFFGSYVELDCPREMYNLFKRLKKKNLARLPIEVAVEDGDSVSEYEFQFNCVCKKGTD